MGQRFGDGGEEIEERIVDQIAKMTRVQIGKSQHVQRELRMLRSAPKQTSPISAREKTHKKKEKHNS